MNRADAKGWLKDGNLKFLAGQDFGRPAVDIDRDQISFGINTSVRNGPASPRPGFKIQPLSFTDTKTSLRFQTGKFQEAEFYNPGGNIVPALLSSLGGRQFRTDIANWETQEITPSAVYAVLTTGPTASLTVTTTAAFTIPALLTAVSVEVTDSSKFIASYPNITIAGFPLLFADILDATHIAVLNQTLANVGTVVGHPSTVAYTGFGTFTIPAVAGSVSVPVQDSSRFTVDFPFITIGGYPFQFLSAPSSTQIVVQNNTLANVGVVVTSPVTVNLTSYDLNSGTLDLAWSIVAENYWILQDSQSYAVIFDGSQCRRSNPEQAEIPVGNVMCYTMGRIAVALPDRQTYTAGDILFGSSGTPALGFRDSILRFTENQYLNEGGNLVARVFGAPSNSGDILAMKAGAMSDTSLGQGAMLVGTPNVIFSVNLPFDRTTWKNTVNPMVTANPISGPLGQNSTTLVNVDLWYRAVDGWRSYITAQRQFNGSWGNTSMSNELGDILDNDTESLLEHGSSVYFGGRLISTISPVNSPNGVYHRALSVLDFNPTTSINKKSPPAWEGFWQMAGLRILKIIKGIVNKQERCFIFSLNDQSAIEIWELTKGDKFDTTASGPQDIVWEVQLPAYNCGDSDRFKKLKTARFVLLNLSGTLNFTVQYRTDESPCWTNWLTGSRCAQVQDCGPDPCSGPTTFNPQTRWPVRLPEPPDTFDTITKNKKSTGYTFQPRLQMTGFGELKEFRIYCIDEPESLGVNDRNAS